MNRIGVYLLGGEDWNRKFNIPASIRLAYTDRIDPADKKLKDLVILDRDIDKNELNYLMKITRSYCLYITENAKMTEHTLDYCKARRGKRLYTGDLDAFWKNEAVSYFSGSYGESFLPEFLQVNQMFKGQVSFKGKYELSLTGNFGNDFSQIAYWKSNIPLFKGQCLDLFLEYEKSGKTDVHLKIFQFISGQVENAATVWEFDSEQLKDVIRIENTGEDSYLAVSVLAKGEGTLIIRNLHDRYSRRNLGFFLPGGERFVTSKGEEIFAYFDPGDMKPPICCYFSGYRTQEGFEGYYMMRSLECPFILLTDPRLEGGAFYLGDEEYEKMVLHIIEGYMKRFNADSSKLIMSGASMGTFGALYYGSRLKPHAFILGKPLVNPGNIAKNETLVRVGTFPTSLEIMMKECGGLGPEKTEEFNRRLWDRFDVADWSHTKFIISYLLEDDYDGTAYSDILTHLSSAGVSVYGKGLHGRHTDNTRAVFEWFKSQYAKVLREDFKRKI